MTIQEELQSIFDIVGYNQKKGDYYFNNQRILSLKKKEGSRLYYRRYADNILNIPFPPLPTRNHEDTKHLVNSTLVRYIHKVIMDYLEQGTQKDKLTQYLWSLSYSTLGLDTFSFIKKGSVYTYIKEITGSDSIIKLSSKKIIIYVPLAATKELSDYEFIEITPDNKAVVISPGNMFSTLFLLHWMNIHRTVEFTDSDCLYRAEAYLPTIFNYNWDKETLPSWLKEKLTGRLSEAEGQPKLTYHDGFADRTGGAGLVLRILSYCYSDYQFKLSDLLVSSSYALLDGVKNFCLQVFLSILLKRQAAERMIKCATPRAKAYTTKRWINPGTINAMKKSGFLSHFGYVEFDNQVDLYKVHQIEIEFKRLNKDYFYGIRLDSHVLRFRKLGRYKAAGVYFPSIKTMVVDFRHPYSFIHEYFHLLDYHFDLMSSTPTFSPIIDIYKRNVRALVDALKETPLHKRLQNNRSKYNLKYYFKSEEIFARCGELYFMLNNVNSSLLKPSEEDVSFAYPKNDPELNQLILDFYKNFLQRLSDQQESKR